MQEAEAKKQEATEELSKAKSRVVALTDKMDTDDDKPSSLALSELRPSSSKAGVGDVAQWALYH